VWCRTCSQCHRVLMKEHLQEIMKCECGWTWGDSSTPERRSRERQKPLDLNLSDHFSELS
jgi:hypothetical protein